jgi:F0F1-type ATP synthase assembly protein I
MLGERARWAAYGLVAGLVLGIFVGWFFHWFFSFVARFFLVILILLPFIAAFLFWRRINRRSADGGVTDANWRQIDRSGDDRTG